MIPLPEVTCLIPAWNEAARLPAVLAAVTGHPLIAEILVVDDGSTDATAQIARASGARLLQTPGNQGKTAALRLGLAEVQTPLVLLLDADLIGLTPGAISALITPVQSGQAAASISLRGNAPRLWRLIGLDYISGERVLPMALLRPALSTLDRLPRFGFEVFLNRQLIAAGLSLAIIRWPDVASPSKAQKQGLLPGFKADLSMLGDIFRTIGLWDCTRQIHRLRQLRIPASRVASET